MIRYRILPGRAAAVQNSKTGRDLFQITGAKMLRCQAASMAADRAGAAVAIRASEPSENRAMTLRSG